MNLITKRKCDNAYNLYYFSNPLNILFDLYSDLLLINFFGLIKITPDKWKHFFVGILMGAVLQMGALFAMPMHFGLSIIITFILVVAISYGFELFSLITKKGHYDILDAVAGIVGGVVGMSLILLIKPIW